MRLVGLVHPGVRRIGYRRLPWVTVGFRTVTVSDRRVTMERRQMNVGGPDDRWLVPAVSAAGRALDHAWRIGGNWCAWARKKGRREGGVGGVAECGEVWMAGSITR